MAELVHWAVWAWAAIGPAKPARIRAISVERVLNLDMGHVFPILLTPTEQRPCQPLTGVRDWLYRCGTQDAQKAARKAGFAKGQTDNFPAWAGMAQAIVSKWAV